MTDIGAIPAANAKRWQVAKIVPMRQAEVGAVVVRLVAAAKFRYQAVSKAVRARPTTGRSSRPSVCGKPVATGTASWGLGDHLNQVSTPGPRGREPRRIGTGNSERFSSEGVRQKSAALGTDSAL
jgi:hypothetical protein